MSEMPKKCRYNKLKKPFIYSQQLTVTMKQILVRSLGLNSVGLCAIQRLRFTFTPNGKREFVPRDQVFPLIVVNCLLLQLKK